jgi:hypothetical protein
MINVTAGQLVLTKSAEGGALTAGMAVMKGAAAGKVKAPTGAGVRPAGIVLLAAAAALDNIPVVVFGPAVGVAGGSVSEGDMLKIAGTTGKLIATTTANDEVIGKALEDGSDGVELGVLVYPGLY